MYGINHNGLTFSKLNVCNDTFNTWTHEIMNTWHNTNCMNILNLIILLNVISHIRKRTMVVFKPFQIWYPDLIEFSKLERALTWTDTLQDFTLSLTLGTESLLGSISVVQFLVVKYGISFRCVSTHYSGFFLSVYLASSVRYTNGCLGSFELQLVPTNNFLDSVYG